jgi:DNA-binding CsgD family transcriptional regulator
MARNAGGDGPSGEILEAIYAAGTGEIGWEMALGEMARGVGTDIVAIFADDPASSRPFTCLTNAAPDIEAVFATWSSVAKHQDPVRAFIDRFPVRKICRSSDLVSYSQFRASGFYRDYAVRFGGTQFMDVDLERSSHGLLNVCLWSQERHAALDDQSVRTLELVLPHLARALRVERRLGRGRLQHDFALAALNALSTPVLVVDDRAAVSFANAAAQDLVAIEDGLVISRGVIGTTSTEHPSLATTLRLLIGARRERLGIHTLTVERSGKRPLALTVFLPPASNELWAEAGTGAGAVIFVGDPEQELADVDRNLQRIHGLTEREARAAISLANGLDLKTIARDEGVGVETIRKHLKQAFWKTGTSRQAELVRLVLLEIGRHRSQDFEPRIDTESLAKMPRR